MADFSQNITNSVNVFGAEHATEWGQANYPYTMVWGVTKWGEGSYTIIFEAEKYIDAGSVAATDSYIYEVQKLISESITPVFETSSETLQDGSWYYVFNGNTTEGESRYTSSYTTGSNQTTSFTCLAAQSTTWTQE